MLFYSSMLALSHYSGAGTAVLQQYCTKHVTTFCCRTFLRFRSLLQLAAAHAADSRVKLLDTIIDRRINK